MNSPHMQLVNRLMELIIDYITNEPTDAIHKPMSPRSLVSPNFHCGRKKEAGAGMGVGMLRSGGDSLK